MMSPTVDSKPSTLEPPPPDGFDVLDVCHRHTIWTLGKLSALVARLGAHGPDGEARLMAAEIVSYFSGAGRQHHEDEERHVFPQIMAGIDLEAKRNVLRLQQDHFWIEEDWREIAPLLDAVAGGQSWVDLDELRASVEVFSALYHDHIALEEACIYPEARERLQGVQRREMGREMAARRKAGRVPVGEAATERASMP